MARAEPLPCGQNPPVATATSPFSKGDGDKLPLLMGGELPKVVVGFLLQILREIVREAEDED